VADFLLRDLDAALMEALRERARRSGRSLQAEMHAALRAWARPALTPEEWAAAARVARKELSTRRFPDAVELIRERRDSPRRPWNS